MDNINNNLYSLWKKDFVNLLFCIVAKVMFFWKSSVDVEIPKFVNIEHRREIRAERWNARHDLEEEWGDTPESRRDNEINGWKYHYIFNLRSLFEMRDLYEEILEIENIQYEERRRREEEEERRIIAELVERRRLREEELLRRLRLHVKAPGG